MRSYFNLFLTLVMPVSILFTAIAIVYFSMQYSFSEALKLGVLGGVIAAISFTFLATFIISIVRLIRIYSSKPKNIITNTHIPNKPTTKVKVATNPTIYEQKSQSTQENLTNDENIDSNFTIEKFMLLMGKELAYEISLETISKQKLGNIIHEDKNQGLIVLQDENENNEIKINVSSLTKHTSQITMSSTYGINKMKKIIKILKEKEHSFMQY